MLFLSFIGHIWLCSFSFRPTLNVSFFARLTRKIESKRVRVTHQWKAKEENNLIEWDNFQCYFFISTAIHVFASMEITRIKRINDVQMERETTNECIKTGKKVKLNHWKWSVCWLCFYSWNGYVALMPYLKEVTSHHLHVKQTLFSLSLFLSFVNYAEMKLTHWHLQHSYHFAYKFKNFILWNVTGKKRSNWYRERVKVSL